MHVRFIAALVFLASVAAPAGADFEGTMDSRMVTEGRQTMTGTGRTYLSRSGFRMEMQMAVAMAAGGGPTDMKVTTLILRSKPGVAYIVNDAKKTYSEIDASKGGREEGPPEKYTVKKLGTERVAGYDCVHALVTGERGEEFEIWSTKELGAASEYWASQRGGPRGRAALLDAMKSAGADGWPMRWKHRSSGDTQVTWEVTKVEKKSVPASLFDLSGYTKAEGGVTGAASQMQLSPEQQKKMDEAMQKQQESLQKLPPDQRKRIEEMMKSMGR